MAPSSARFSALRHRNFRLIWTGQIVSNVGTWMQSVGTGWLVLQLTNSPLWLGLLGLSFALPMIVCRFLLTSHMYARENSLDSIFPILKKSFFPFTAFSSNVGDAWYDGYLTLLKYIMAQAPAAIF